MGRGGAPAIAKELRRLVAILERQISEIEAGG